MSKEEFEFQKEFELIGRDYINDISGMVTITGRVFGMGKNTIGIVMITYLRHNDNCHCAMENNEFLDKFKPIKEKKND